ncbi:hypothetical protein TRIP_C60495 [Candidatus Zixiibacteriota bacterium]|nr:hypothetical protein TRIP_C60495 [candidate division Zixibacteria bacterium]
MKRLLPIIFLLLLYSSLLLVLMSGGCGKNSTSSTVQFMPGTYRGIYEVIKHWQSPDQEMKVDTMNFYFIQPDTFRMYLADDDNYRRFCDVIRGKFIFGRDSLKLQNITTNTSQQCTPGEEPGAEYQYLVDHGIIVFKTSDTALYRRIELWNKL